MKNSLSKLLNFAFTVMLFFVGVLSLAQAKAEGTGSSNGTLSLVKTVFAKNERVIIDYSDGAEHRKDWVGIFRLGSLGESCEPDDDYVTWKYANRKKGRAGFRHLPPGDYQAQLFSNDGYCHIGDAISFTVTKNKLSRTGKRHVSKYGVKSIDDGFLPKRRNKSADQSLDAASRAAKVSRQIAPLANTFKLHSRPSATKVIYLDFDGHKGFEGNYSAFDLDGSSNSFSDAERTRIQEVWKSVSEDFIPFDVDVTTEFPGIEALKKTGNGDTKWGIRTVVSSSVWDYSWAYINSFNSNQDMEAF